MVKRKKAKRKPPLKPRSPPRDPGSVVQSEQPDEIFEIIFAEELDSTEQTAPTGPHNKGQ